MRGGVYLFGAEHGAAEEPFDVLVAAVARLAREAQEHMR
jgi:hypothetical protein